MSTDAKKRAALLACVPIVLGLVPGVAAAASTEETPLTPELVTLAEPAVATAPEAQQAEAIGAPVEGPGSLVRKGEAVVVEAHFEEGALAQIAALEAAGATVLEASSRYQTVALAVAPEDLEALAEVPGLEAVEPSRAPVFYGAEASAGPTTSVVSNGLCEGGSVISQAMTQLRVAAARGAFGARGAGQTIGVISDSFNTATEAIGGGPIATHAHEDEVTNDLPGPASTCSGQQVPVKVFAEGPAGTTDEGRAMLQTIHDLAPHAQLAFATAYATELQFAHNIEVLAAPVSAGGAGADVIVDDVAYYEEPFFQDGPVAVAIKNVTEAGVTYLTAAGNNNLISQGNDYASWEREEFLDTTCPGAVVPYVFGASSNCLNFSPNATDDPAFGITVAPKSKLVIDLQWAEPWYGVHADLNAFLLDANEEVVIVKQTKKNAGSGAVPQPVELLFWENESTHPVEVKLVIDRCVGFCNFGAEFFAKPRVKFALLENGGGVSKTEYQKAEGGGIKIGPTMYGHAGTAGAITVAAANYEQSPTAPVEPEKYTSRGPATHYFGPVVSSSKPAAELAKQEVLEPSVTGTDCASTTFFASLLADGWHFCGTSEAAPHVAAVAALMRQTEPSATPSQILAALKSTATHFVGLKKPSAVGAGLVNAEAAIPAVGGVPVSDPASVVVPAVGETTPPTQGTATPPPGSSSPPAKKKHKPKARIVAHPKALEKTHKSSIVARFRFAANEASVTFSCQVDKASQRPCGARYKRRFGIGSHVVKVRAVSSAEHASSSPVSFRFRVKRVGR
ncbi:MAG TPA: S8 family serine peptidase [Solirubrobacterales bacterium]|nr:S8 family serine peptidase [Solirubrobacterales bacterium]